MPGEAAVRRPGQALRTAVCAGALAVVGATVPARAEFTLTATEVLQRDDNVFRLPAGLNGEAPPDDTVQRTRLGWDLQLQSGRQRLGSTGNWEDVHHRRWSVLSHRARELAHTAELQALSHGRLTLQRSDRVALSTDDQLLSVLRNEPGLEHLWQQGAALRWEPPRGWGAYARWTREARRYRSALDAARDVTQDSRALGVAWTGARGWRVEAGPLWREVDRAATSGLPGESARLVELAANAATADGRWQGSLRHARGTRRTDAPGTLVEDPDVRSTRAELRWASGARWTARLSASDDRGSDFVYGATPLGDGAVAVDVRGLVPRRLQVLQFETGFAPTGKTRWTAWAQAIRREELDRLQALGLSGLWAPDRHLSAGCSVARETREVSPPAALRPYHAQRWQCWLGWRSG